MKIKSRIKVPLLLLLLLLQAGYTAYSFFIPSVNSITGLERCIDADGIWDSVSKKCEYE